MARTAAAKIRITGDADGVKRATREAESSLGRLNKAAKAAAVAGVAVAGAAFVKFGADSIGAAKESEAAMARVRKNIEAVGLDYEKYSDQIDAAAAAAAKKGFDDEAAAESASRLAQKNKDVAEGIRLSNVAMDIARGKNISLEAATQLVVKAQMGQAGALRRLGIDIDKSASSQEMLATLQQRYAGQADAYAKTGSGAADRLKVSWENFQETIGQKLIPIIAKLQVKLADFIDWLNEDWPRIWARVKNEAKPVLEWLWPFVKRIFDNVKNAIQLVVNILQGDWGEAWGNVKTIVSNQIKNLGQLAGTAARAGLAIGKAIGRGIANGLIALVEMGVNKAIDGLNGPGKILNKVIPGGDPIPSIGHITIPRVGGSGKLSSTGGENSEYMASGGVVPGPAGAGDIVPARLTPGEVVLNKRQQSLIGANRIMSVLAATGGKIGGGRFATGGVAAALKFAQAQLGEPYVWGGGHEGVVERRGWDCSGFASNVAARVPGYTGGIGTTMSLYPRSKRAKGNEPVVFGFLGMDSNDPRKQHMGIRINGQWFEAAGGGRGVIRGRSNWPSGLRIPPGLESLSVQASSSLSPNEADGGQSPVTRQAAAQKAAVTKAVAAALKGTSYSERDGMSSSPSGAAASSISQAVTAAGRVAMAAGQTPEQIREAMDDRQRNLEIAWVKREITTALTEMRKVSGAIAKVRARLKTARKALGKARAVKGRARGPAVQKAYGVVLALVKKEQELLEAQSGVREWLTDLRARALDLDIAAQEDALEGTDTSSSTSSVDAGVDADTSAQLTQAQTAAATAAAGQLASDQFIRAALGPGDLTQGGLTAWQAAGGTINVSVQTLHPGDPNTLQAIVEAVARAANQSPSTMATGEVITV